MAVNNLMALRTSLDSLLKEGIQNRLERYQQLAIRLRAGLRSIGYEPFTSDEQMSPVLTAAVPPGGISVPDLIEYLAKEHRIMIAPGLGELMGKIFRIGHMSPVTTPEDIDETVASIAAFGNT